MSAANRLRVVLKRRIALALRLDSKWRSDDRRAWLWVAQRFSAAINVSFSWALAPEVLVQEVLSVETYHVAPAGTPHRE